MQYAVQSHFDHSVAKPAPLVLCLQLLNSDLVFIKRVQIREDNIAFDLSGVFDTQMVWVGKHSFDGGGDFI